MKCQYLYVGIRAVFAAGGGFLFGYDLGSFNGAKDMKGFRETFNLSFGDENNTSNCDSDIEDSTILGLMTSVIILGSLLGALLAGVLADFAGRKRGIMIGGMLFAVGGALQSGAVYLWMIFVGRVIAGVGNGIVLVVVPIYIAEISPKQMRGRFVSFAFHFLALGIMIGYIVNLICKMFAIGWRIALGLQCGFSLILVIGMLFLPETPRWLVKKHKVEKAQRVLARIYSADKEVMQTVLDEVIQDATIGKEGAQDILRFFFTWNVFKRVLIGGGLLALSSLSGVTVVSYYSVTLFCKVGVDGFVASVVLGVGNYFLSLLAPLFVDKVGRKPLLLWGSFALMTDTVAAATLILAFRLEVEDNKAVGYIVAALICIFNFVYTFTVGACSATVDSEIYPLKTRGLARSVTNSAAWIGNFAPAMLTPILIASPLRTYGTFYLVAGANLTLFVFVLLTLPETKGVSLEKMDALFSQPWLQRTNIFYYLRCGCPWGSRNSRQLSSEHAHNEVETDRLIVKNGF